MRSVVQVAPGGAPSEIASVFMFVGLISVHGLPGRRRGKRRRPTDRPQRVLSQAGAKSVRAVMTPRSPSRIRASRKHARRCEDIGPLSGADLGFVVRNLSPALTVS